MRGRLLVYERKLADKGVIPWSNIANNQLDWTWHLVLTHSFLDAKPLLEVYRGGCEQAGLDAGQNDNYFLNKPDQPYPCVSAHGHRGLP